MVKSRKKIVFAIAALAFAGLFLAFQLFGFMSLALTDNKGDMPNCHNGTSGFCPMSYSEHALEWQSITAALNVSQTFYYLVLVIAAFIFVSLLFKQVEAPFIRRLDNFLAREKNFLLEAFSGGILNPKTF